MQKNSKKVLFISYDGMTDPLGQSQVIPYLQGLTKYGYEFTILSCDKPSKFKKYKNYIESILNNYPIKWVSIPYHKKPPVLSSILDFWEMKRKAIKLYQKEKFVLVHTRPSIPPIIALILKKKFGVKYINDIRGFWADEKVDSNSWNLKNPIYRILYNFFKKNEIKAVQLADFNTCLTHKGKAEMLTWKNVPQPVKVAVVPCSVDTNLFNPSNIDFTLKSALKAELGITDSDFILSYLGSIGGWYLTKEMMMFFKLLLKKIPQAKFLFISNNNHQDILEIAKEFDIPTTKIIIKFGNRLEVPTLLSFSNYSLFFIKKCYSKIASSPTKHGEIMSMGIPVIANRGVGDVEEIIEKYNAGYILDGFSESEFEVIIDKICKNSICFDANNIRDGAKDYYNLEKTLITYSSVYKAVLA